MAYFEKNFHVSKDDTKKQALIIKEALIENINNLKLISGEGRKKQRNNKYLEITSNIQDP